MPFLSNTLDCPNCKVNDFVPGTWISSWDDSVDKLNAEQTRIKHWIRKFKKIEDCIQAGCIADDGYTYDFYFRNEPVPQEMD